MKLQKITDMNDQLARGKILPLLLKLTLPATVAQLVNALYSIVDRMYIGRMHGVGTAALGGLGLTFPIIMLITAFSVLVGMGGSPLASIRMGEGDEAGAQRYLGNAVTLLLLIGAVLTVVCLVWKDPLLIAFGASENTLPYASDYLEIYLFGTIFVQLALGLNSFINAQGYAGMGMLTVVIGAVLNVALDPLFIYTFGMGVKGAAVATVISQFVSAFWVIVFLCSKHSKLRITLRDMRLDWQVVKSTCALGISTFIFLLNESIVIIVINRLLRYYGGSMGDLHIASMAILSSLGQIFFMPLKGIVQGAQPLISYNMGARNFPRIKETIYYARICSITCTVLMWAGMMFAPHYIMLAFTSDPALTDLTVTTMRLMYCTVFVLGMQMINQNAFVAMGNTRYSFFFGILRKVLLLLPLAFILPVYTGIMGIYAAEAISNLITVVVTYVAFTKYLNQIKLSFEPAN
ncbi:MATE family efflux transporter [Oscillospiraceae bacterium PP1C4]